MSIRHQRSGAAIVGIFIRPAKPTEDQIQRRRGVRAVDDREPVHVCENQGIETGTCWMHISGSEKGGAGMIPLFSPILSAINEERIRAFVRGVRR